MAEAALGRTRKFLANKNQVALALAGLAAIVWLVTRISVAVRFPLFFDDAVEAGYAQVVAFDPASRFIALHDDRGLMGSWMTGALVKVGFTPIGAVQVYHLVATFLTAILTPIIAYRIWGRKVALAVIGIVLVLPFMFVYSVVGILDTFVAACAVAAFLIEMQLVKRPRYDLAIVLGFIFGAALLTKQSGPFLLLLLPFSLILYPWGSASRKRFLQWLACAAIALVLAGLAYSLQFLTPIYYDNYTIPNHRPLSDALKHPFTYFSQNWPGFRAGIVGYLTPTLLVLLAAGLWEGFRTHPRHTALISIWALTPFAAASLVATIPAPRYLVFGVPFVAILIGLGLAKAVGYALTRREATARYALLAAVALLFVPALYFDGALLKNPENAPYPGADEWHYVTSQQLSGGPLPEVLDEIRNRSRGETKPTVITHNSFNPTTLIVSLNGRHYGKAAPYNVSGTSAVGIPPDARFVIIENEQIGPYYKYGWPIDALFDTGGARGFADARYADIVPQLEQGGFRLVRTIPRPRNGAKVLFYEKPLPAGKGSQPRE